MVTYDIHADNNLQDINTDAGFIYALILCMRIGSGKFCWLAPLCSSWVWICRGTTGRSPLFPEGRSHVAAVHSVAAVAAAAGC